MRADSSHIVLFTQQAVDDVTGLFKEIFGVPATNLQPHPSGVGSSVSAPSGSLAAQLHVLPGRIELVAGPAQNTNATLPFVEWEVALDLVRSKAPIVLQKFDVSRLAVIANIFETAQSFEETTQAFMSATHINVPADSTDLVFIMNRRRNMESTGIAINRLMRWDATLRQIMQISNQALTPITHNFHVLTRQFDVNSVPRAQPMTKPVAGELLEFLVNEVNQCISGGYEYLVNN